MSGRGQRIVRDRRRARPAPRTARTPAARATTPKTTLRAITRAPSSTSPRDLQAEVSPAPLVSPADAVGFGEEFTRISQEFYVGSKDAQATAQELLTVLEGMQPAQ